MSAPSASLQDARPETPTSVPPEGFHYEVCFSDVLDWVAPPIGAGRCRLLVKGHRQCGRPPVASLKRGNSGWWDYCERHLYGRWIEDGKVAHWHLVPNASGTDASPSGVSS